MQAIKTKYLPATNYKGSRIKAEYYDGSIVISYDYSMSIVDLHRLAATKLIAKLGWGMPILHTGELKDGMVHVLSYPNPIDNLDLPSILKPQA